MLSHKLSHLQKHVKDHKKGWAWLGAAIVIAFGVLYFSEGNLFGFPFGLLQKSDTLPLIIAPYNNAGLNHNVDQSSAENGADQFVDPHERVIVAAVQKASPAVVSIVISKDVPVIEQCPSNPFSDLPPEFQQFFGFDGAAPQFYAPCQKGTQKQDVGGGSGFIVSANGYVVTNKHVVSDTAAEYTVFTNDGKKYKAKVIARHPTLDLAVIKIDGANLPTVELGDSNNLMLGQDAIAIGYALGQFRNTVSVGIISGLARNITAATPEGSGSESINDVIQTDAPINPGNSGGPLLNSRGQVIGINVAMVSGAQNIGFSIPINQAKSAIESAQTAGKISVAYLGVRYVMLDPTVAGQYNVSSTQGALIRGDNKTGVEAGSPADKAGLRQGDVIIQLNGKAIDDSYPLSAAISERKPGDIIQLTVVREGKTMTVSVTLGEKK